MAKVVNVQLTRLVAPLAADDAYPVGTRWFVPLQRKIYICSDNTRSAAVWKESSGEVDANLKVEWDARSPYQLFTAGEIIAAEKMVYIKASDGRVYAASSAAESTSVAIGMTLRSATAGVLVLVQMSGPVQLTGKAFAGGNQIYLSTAGGVDTLPAVGAGKVRKCLGHTLEQNVVWLNIQEGVTLS